MRTTFIALPEPEPEPVSASAMTGTSTAATIRLAVPTISAPLSNTFEPEWPPRFRRVPKLSEIDRAARFDPAEVRAKLLTGQLPFLGRLLEVLDGRPCPDPWRRSRGR